MYLQKVLRSLAAVSSCALFISACVTSSIQPSASIGEAEYFEATGVNLLAFSSPPGGLFFDAKTSGIEIIHHGERTVTNGDVRLLHAPEQWDGMGQLLERSVDKTSNTITTRLAYPEHHFTYIIKAMLVPSDAAVSSKTVSLKTPASSETTGQRFKISVELEQPLPSQLVGKAGFNLEFLPSVYWDKAYLMDGRSGQFPRSASNPSGMTINAAGLPEPLPLAKGQSLVLAAADPQHRVTIHNRSSDNALMLFDGRTKAQNGWYVVRSMIPAGKVGTVLEWELDVATMPGWVRPPVIGHSQVGYHPQQVKKAVVELDKNTADINEVKLLRVSEDGNKHTVMSGMPQKWGRYLRYDYWVFDFSAVVLPGLYQLQYGAQVTSAFRIDEHVFADVWQPTLDFFFPVQMDHMKVKDAYRTWHGASHLDDALQAPPNYEHFDLYAHDGNLDTRFKPFEHIPGLNYGGWYDAGDYDIRTQSQYETVQGLVHAYEEFHIERDNTTVSQEKKYTQINRPDGQNDLLQQIEHGTLALIAQHRALGHAIPGIVAGRLYQYPHLGDGSTKTDNKIYRSKMDPHAETRKVGPMYEPSTIDPTPTEDAMPEDGLYSGRFDDRWAFTSSTSALNYGSAAALAAASRALRNYNDALARECLATAQRVWQFETQRAPNLYMFGNTTGNRFENEKFNAAAELLLSTRHLPAAQTSQYVQVVQQSLPQIRARLGANTVAMLVQVMPFMDNSFTNELETIARRYRAAIIDIEKENPFGVPITRGGWAGNGRVMDFGITNYWFNKVFPDLIEDELVYRSLDYIFGTHPDSNYSFVSGIGAQSQTQAYGNNRADFSYIPGGVVPGVLVLPPDYPENKSDWPFFWGQNEYVIPMGSRYIFLTHAAQKILTQ